MTGGRVPRGRRRGPVPAHVAGRPRHRARRAAYLPRFPRPVRWAVLVVVLLSGSLAFPDPVRAQTAPAFGSDDFDRVELGNPWTVVDPLGDGIVAMEGAGTGDARLLLTVPSGQAHEAWGPNGSLRVMRPAEDTDFTAVVKFESVPTLRFQSQGILVQQDADDWLRFDVHHNGSRLRAYAADTVAGTTSSILNKPGSAASHSYLRVTRSGDTWALATSGDGEAWSTAGSFTRALDVTSVGVMAGNAGSPSPAFTAVADYLFEASSPIDPEDGGAQPGAHTLTVATDGPGSVSRSPEKQTYADGEPVTLTAVPGPGASFSGWSGDAAGGANPTVITMDGDKAVTATFAPDATPPLLTGVSAEPGATSAVVTWTTDEPSSSSVSVGPTPAYELGAFGSAALATTHSVTITGLAPETAYHYQPSSTNAAGLTATAPDATFTTGAAPVAEAVSDDFNRTELGPDWAVVDPRNDGSVSLTGAGTPDAVLRLAVPSGVSHDPWQPSNNSLRVMRPADDGDVTYEVKFDSTPTAKYQLQGLLVEQDADDWIRFNLHHNGSGLRAYAATTVAGVSTKRIDVATVTGPHLWLQVQRSGNQWTLRTSTDGANWVNRGSFTHALDVTAVGPFAGNSGSPVPAFEASVDYVFDTSAPVIPEDTPPTTVTHTLATEVVGAGSITRQPDLPEYYEGTDVTLTAVPAAGATFVGWAGDLSGGDNPATLTIDGDKAVTATFAADTTPPVVSGTTVAPSSTSAVVTWQTDEPATSSVSVGPTAAYEMGAFGSSALATSHSVTLTGLTPGATYHYQVSSANGGGLVTTQPDATFATPASGGPAIDVWYGPEQTVGSNGQAQSAYNLLGNVGDPDGVAALSYSLNGGPSRALTIGPDQRRVYGVGDFNADIAFTELDLGENEVVVTARDGTSEVSTATVVLDRVPGSAPLPYSVDWSSTAQIGDRGQVVDGKWSIDGDTVRPVELGYDRLVMFGDISWENYELTVSVTPHNLGPGHGTHLSNAALVGLALNWRGHTQVNNEQPPRHWYPTGAFAWYRWFDPTPKFELRGNGDNPVVRHSRFQLAFGQTYMFKARSESVSGGVRYSWKVWPQGQPEPGAWDLTLVEPDGPQTGSVGLIAHQVNVQFGDVNVVPIGS